MVCPIDKVNNACPTRQVPGNHDTVLQQFKRKTYPTCKNNRIQSIFHNRHLSFITTVYLEYLNMVLAHIARVVFCYQQTRDSVFPATASPSEFDCVNISSPYRDCIGTSPGSKRGVYLCMYVPGILVILEDAKSSGLANIG
jgi:hypothetical protein